MSEPSGTNHLSMIHPERKVSTYAPLRDASYPNHTQALHGINAEQIRYRRNVLNIINSVYNMLTVSNILNGIG